MKKLVFAALAIGAMAACTKSNVQYEQPGEISFQPVTQKATKAAVAGPTYPTDDAAYNFNVWAWWGNDNATIDETYSKFSSLYIDKGTFVHKGNNTWGGDPAYYWPTTGSLVFAGYSPAINDGGTFTYARSTKTFKVEGYVQSNVTTQTKDLMWFDITDKSYNTRRIGDQSPVELINKTAGVSVTFKHALSWLTFRFNVTDSETSGKWIVKEVKLNGINTKGTGTAVKGEETVAWDPISEPTAITVFEGSHTVVYKDKDNDASNVDNGGVIVIPQTCTTVTIKFTQQNYAGGSQEQEITLPLNAGTADGKTWKSGKKYIYTITFAADEILIAPDVADWTEEKVNIPVEF